MSEKLYFVCGLRTPPPILLLFQQVLLIDEFYDYNLVNNDVLDLVIPKNRGHTFSFANNNDVSP